MERNRSSAGHRLRTGAIWAALLAGAIVLLLSVPLVSEVLIDRLQIFPPVTSSELKELMHGPPAAIVILSAGRRAYAPEFGGETVDELSLERIRYGAMLARQTALPVLVSGGLAGPKARPLATLMADVLVQDYGIRPRWIEARARNTAENAIFSAQMLKRAGVGRVILVTHAWHMKRARAAFLANGLSVIPAPTAFYQPGEGNSWAGLIPAMRSLRMSGYAIHETLGNQWYALRYGY